MLVAALTASSSWSNLGLKATVKAQSMICPLMCVPKSTAGAGVSSWLPALKQKQTKSTCWQQQLGDLQSAFETLGGRSSSRAP